MADFLLLMHDDTTAPIGDWEPYFAALRQAGAFNGGSAIGAGESIRKDATPLPLTATLGGYIRIEAASLAAAKALVAGNPVYEAGGTVEVRELPRE